MGSSKPGCEPRSWEEAAIWWDVFPNPWAGQLPLVALIHAGKSMGFSWLRRGHVSPGWWMVSWWVPPRHVLVPRRLQQPCSQLREGPVVQKEGEAGLLPHLELMHHFAACQRDLLRKKKIINETMEKYVE